MKTKNLLFAFALSFSALALTSGCQKSSSAPDAQTVRDSATSEGNSDHGAPGAKPGSHEDWCGEHDVPESLCSRCHPDLVAAFKATGDWCAQHGLPESQCKQCNPDLVIKRPEKGK